MSAENKPYDIDDEAQQLWEFALALYEADAVKQACLSVQARYGLSVSLLLGAVWVGANGYGRLGATELETAIRRGMEWHREIVEPLRALRHRLRQHPPPGQERRIEKLRHRLLEQELEAERIEQRLFLEDFPLGPRAATTRERWRDAAVNAALFTRKSCPQPEPQALEAISCILQMAFPGVSAAGLARETEAVWRVG